MLNAINQIRVVKQELREYRNSGWSGLVQEVNTFCQVHDIQVADLKKTVPMFARMKRGGYN